MDLGEQLKSKACDIGSIGVGICAPLSLPHNMASLNRMLPKSRSVVCIMFSHSEAALASSDIYLKQYDTVFCYSEVVRISHQLARYLETEGYQAAAIPAFVPLDYE